MWETSHRSAYAASAFALRATARPLRRDSLRLDCYSHGHGRREAPAEPELAEGERRLVAGGDLPLDGSLQTKDLEGTLFL
jgi:hypothetical protein